MECIGKVGALPNEITIRDLKAERPNGYLKVFSVQVDGVPHRYEFTDRGSSVAILPVDYERKEIYLIKTPRPTRAFARDGAAVDWLGKKLRDAAAPSAITVPGDQVNLWEVPAGMIDASDESEVVAAIREGDEEIDITFEPKDLRELCPVTLSIGGSTELSYLYIARVHNRKLRVTPKGDGTENIEVWRVSFDEARELVRTSSMVTATSRILILTLMLSLAEQRADFEHVLRRASNGG